MRDLFFQEATISAAGNDPCAAALEDRRMAAADAEGAITGHSAGFLVFRDLVHNTREHGSVALAAGSEFQRPEAADRRVHLQMDLGCWRRRWVPWFLADHSPSPRNLIPALSTAPQGIAP